MLRFVPVAILAILLVPAAGSAQWPVARGDALMTGKGNAKLPEKLEIKWEFQAGTQKTGGVEGAPAIVDGVVYLASLDKHLYAVDLASGKEKWKVKLGPMKSSRA